MVLSKCHPWVTFLNQVEPVTQVHHETVSHIQTDQTNIHLQHELSEARSTIIRLEREISDMRGEKIF